MNYALFKCRASILPTSLYPGVAQSALSPDAASGALPMSLTNQST